jgi:alkylation response protein AidB-like acyl-CoA dehydrogenase
VSESGFAFGITEPEHGSDATHMKTSAYRDGDEWVINGEKTWSTGMHKAPYELIFARTSGGAGDGDGVTAFLVPTKSPGFEIVEFLWTFNMPTDHAHIRLTGFVYSYCLDRTTTRPTVWRSAMDWRAAGRSRKATSLPITGRTRPCWTNSRMRAWTRSPSAWEGKL